MWGSSHDGLGPGGRGGGRGGPARPNPPWALGPTGGRGLREACACPASEPRARCVLGREGPGAPSSHPLPPPAPRLVASGSSFCEGPGISAQPASLQLQPPPHSSGPQPVHQALVIPDAAPARAPKASLSQNPCSGGSSRRRRCQERPCRGGRSERVGGAEWPGDMWQGL